MISYEIATCWYQPDSPEPVGKFLADIQEAQGRGARVRDFFQSATVHPAGQIIVVLTAVLEFDPRTHVGGEAT